MSPSNLRDALSCTISAVTEEIVDFAGSLIAVPTEKSARKRIQRQNILMAAGLPKMRIHDLRHSAVAILLAQGVNIKAISELLGHSSVAFTLQVYGHLLEETKREAADKMDAVLSPVATTVATKLGIGRVN